MEDGRISQASSATKGLLPILKMVNENEIELATKTCQQTPEDDLNRLEEKSELEKTKDPEQRKKILMIVNTIKALQALKKKKEDCIPAEIMEPVFLGSIGTALSKDVMKERGITHILTCALSLKPAFPNEFEYLCLPLLDSTT
jgi:hypothetical protein